MHKNEGSRLGHELYHQAIRLQWRGALAVVLGLWVVFAGWAYYARQGTFEQHTQILQRLNAQVAEQTLYRLRLVESFLLASDHWLQLHPERDPRSDPGFAALVDGFRALAGQRVDIRLVTARGELVTIPSRVMALPAKAPTPPVTVADRDYFEVAIRDRPLRLFFGNPVQDTASTPWSMPVSMKLSRPVKGIALIVALIDLQHLEAAFESARLQPNGTVLLARADLTIMLRVPEAQTYIGKSIPRDSMLGSRYPGEKQGVYFTDYAALDQRPRLVSYLTLERYPLLVVATSSLGDILKPWYTNVAWMALAALAFSALVVVGTRRLTRLLGALDRLATIDSLTQVANRSFFYTLAENEFRRSKRYHRKLSLLLIDVDHFKPINDSFGHAVGDAVLRAVAQLCQARFRDVDVIGRVGGEEFAVLLPESDLAGATLAAQRVCAAAANHRHRVRAKEIVLTLSIGVAEMGPADKTIERVVARADRALYRAKAAGRNRVVVSRGRVSRPSTKRTRRTAQRA